MVLFNNRKSCERGSGPFLKEPVFINNRVIFLDVYQAVCGVDAYLARTGGENSNLHYNPVSLALLHKLLRETGAKLVLLIPNRMDFGLDEVPARFEYQPFTEEVIGIVKNNTEARINIDAWIERTNSAKRHCIISNVVYSNTYLEGTPSEYSLLLSMPLSLRSYVDALHILLGEVRETNTLEEYWRHIHEHC